MASGFINPFVSGRHPKLVSFVIWFGFAIVMVAAGAWLWRIQIEDSLQRAAQETLGHFDNTYNNVTNAFAELQVGATSEPCSAQFIGEMRRVAFEPDGLNELMYAPGGLVICSTSNANARQQPLALAPPDIQSNQNGIAFWINKRLDQFGFAGMVGSIAFQEPFALIIPRRAPVTTSRAWSKMEIVVAPKDGDHVWHFAGEEGLFEAVSGAKAKQAPLTEVHAVACGEQHPHCVAMKANLVDIAFDWSTEVLLAIGLIGFYAIWPASVAHRWLNAYWSLESRFRRNLDAGSVICAYQPILDLRTGEISAVEVLARWRDADGSIVPPDKFIDLIAKVGKTLDFTKMVADRAHAELSEALPHNARLQVNFNIFPRDLDCEKLACALSAFDTCRHRFDLALEIVESDALLDNAHYEIEALSRRGIRTYIDDFGSGYSSIHRVASLAIYGVKLDRSFAMAPQESLMARMLVHALDMIASSGRQIVVEGVETQERLNLLIESGRADYAQGYLISRPLSIERLAEFLVAHDSTTFLDPKKRAAA